MNRSQDTGRDDASEGFVVGSVSMHVARLSGVMILGFLAMTLGQLVEAAYLGMVGKEELAALAFSFPVAMSLGAMTRGIGVGAASLIARAMGAGQREDAARQASHCYLLILVFTLTLGGLGLLYSRQIFVVLGAEGRVLELVTAYTHIYLAGFPLMGLAMASNGMFRSFGNLFYPGVIMVVGPAIQVTVGPFLIFGWLGLPAMGLVGAAWTFVISAVAQCVVAGYWFVAVERLQRLRLDRFIDSARDILHVGIPAAATNLIQPLSTGVVTWLLSGYGVAVVAGFGVASRIESVVAMVAIGISTSVVPLVGQNWGARAFERVDETLRTCHQACFVWGLIAATIMWVGAPFFVGLINDDPDLVETAVTFLYIIPISVGFMGMINVATHAFNALRRPAPALALSIARLLVVYIPLAMLGSHLFGYVGIFAATAITNLAVGVVAIVWNRRVIATERAAIESEALAAAG